MKENRTWYLFSYKVPPEPSTLRVRIWRNLKALGVLYIQQSVCIVPKTLEVEQKLAKIKMLIDDHAGEAFIIEIKKFAHYSECELIELFHVQRTSEYNELLENCRLFLQELKNKEASHDLNIEESEIKLNRLKRCYRKMMKKDYFKHSLLRDAKGCLQKCEEQLTVYIEMMYESKGATYTS
ncbi:hypothetical protein A374_09129 [Fictibacillus macauensis ZFHKF-1]|uniref:ChrB N-terminal domain-containing protein n=1 Tax=Fictibacillus macauensis ZFHKF-1 TaxID=1196324 RepID=I8AJN8_9BACL|nr:Chromate resistance protein ChrB [Fictibacillus macauensis]EIT85987.1 hypothetical protein A374_09129 [Fictibacillus macauensis ZFHKF-1]